MSNTTTCTIVLPCYNPPKGWAGNIVQQVSVLSKELQGDIDVVVVNDGSTKNISDEDIRVMTEKIPGFKWVDSDVNKGKGYALRKGIAAADTDIIIYTDIDFPYTTESIKKIYDALTSGSCDLAAGVKDDAYYEKVPAARRYISKALRGLIKMFFSIPFTDTQCGLKGFTKDIKPLFLDTSIDRYLFDLEFIRKVHAKKYRIEQVYVSLKDDIEFRKMNYKVLLPELLNLIGLILRRKK